MIGKLLSFDKLMGEGLIKLLYYIGLIFITLGALGSLFAALAAFRLSFGAGFSGLLLTCFGYVVGVLVWRVTCELWIVLFAQYNKVSKIEEAVVKKDDN